LPERRQPQRGLPLGMRETLYIKDDDYRYSFLFGNFITLSNLKERDWARLEEQRLSPLYVSVHTTNPDLRRKMVDGPRSGEIIPQLGRLISLGIACHTQIVLCPGINDGDELDRSIADLARLRPGVASISVVPVGLTKYNNLLKTGDLPPMRSYTVPEALEVVERVEVWQRRFADGANGSVTPGLPFVYLSDEWYYTTRRPFPAARHYADFAQLENGVGMTRKLQDDWRRVRRTLPRRLESPRRLALITGVMAEPVINRLGHDLSRVGGLSLQVVPVANRFFGSQVTVAGLLCGQDVLDETLRRCGELSADDLIALPRVMLDNAGKRFLDDMSVEEFQAAAPAKVVFVKTVEELAGEIATLAGRTDSCPGESQMSV
jgi:putative radical SAM enzyme (TIGR03279 family)